MMIPNIILKTIAKIEENRDFKGRLTKIVAYGIEKLVNKTIPEIYAKSVLKNVNIGRFATISFDCDLIEDVKAYDQLLNILNGYRIKASFAVIGRLIELFPEEHKALIEEGHEILNHTYTHPHSQFNPKSLLHLSYDELYFEIKKFDEICIKILKYKPIGYRAPHFVHIPKIYSILRDLNYSYSSSTMASATRSLGTPYVVKGIVEIPLTPCPKYPFTTFTTWGLSRAPKRWYTEDEFFELFKNVIEFGRINNTYLNFYFDPVDIISIYNIFEEIIKMIKKSYNIITYNKLIGTVINF